MFFQCVRSVSLPHPKNTQPTSFFAPLTKTTVSFAVWSHCVKASVHVENWKFDRRKLSLRVLAELWVLVVRNCEVSCQACNPPRFAFKLSWNLEVGTTLVASDSGKVRSVVRSRLVVCPPRHWVSSDSATPGSLYRGRYRSSFIQLSCCFLEKFLPECASATVVQKKVGKSSKFRFQKKDPSYVLVLTSVVFSWWGLFFLVCGAKNLLVECFGGEETTQNEQAERTLSKRTEHKSFSCSFWN